jgi:hypothetical protein
LPEAIAPAADEPFDLLALDDALDALAVEHPDKATLGNCATLPAAPWKKRRP